MNLKMNDSEKESLIRVVSESIEALEENQVIDDFAHLANLLYVYKKLTGQNYEEGKH
jgi:hypothetical protein